MFQPLTSSDRVLVLAPHPDDECLAAGGLLQCAAAAGAAMRVIYLTDGENNPWPQRVIERRWRIGPDELERWRRRRQAESLASLKVLGVASEHVAFLSMPDQGLTSLLLSRGHETVGVLAEELRRWRPTVLVEPALADLHPDHSAAAVLIDLATKQLGAVPPLRRIAFIVHSLGRSHELPGDGAMALTADQRETKKRAILCHASQTRLRPKGLLAMAREIENFHEVGAMEEESTHPVGQVNVEGQWIRMQLSMRVRIGAFGRATMLVLTARDGLVRGAFEMPVGRQGDVAIRNCATRQAQGKGRYQGNRRQGQAFFPKEIVEAGSTVFVKIERRFGFFDEAGWRMLPRKEIDVADLVSLLGRDSEDSGLFCKLESFGIHGKIERRRGYGWIEDKANGIEILFDPWRSGDTTQADRPSNSLELAAIFLRREGHKGYSEYGGRLEGGVKFGDTKDQIESKLGTPYKSRIERGVSSVVKGAPIPEWLKYKRDNYYVHYQMDELGTLEMVTLMRYEVGAV